MSDKPASLPFDQAALDYLLGLIDTWRLNAEFDVTDHDENLRVRALLVAAGARDQHERRLQINPGPMTATALTCIYCRVRAPFCKCGKAEYR